MSKDEVRYLVGGIIALALMLSPIAIAALLGYLTAR